jgi:hypothetical protein
VVIFDDGGEFLPDGHVVPAPHHCRAAAKPPPPVIPGPG